MLGVSMPRLGLTTLFGGCLGLTSVFDLMYSQQAQTAAAFFGECCTNSTVVKNCKDIVCTVLTEEMQRGWLIRVVTASLYPALAAGALIVVSRCTCIDSEELTAPEQN